MIFDRLHYELRILGKWVFLTPILMMSCLALIAELLSIMHVETLRISQVLTGSLEMLLPVAAGLIVATIVSHDNGLELQLTMLKKYRITAFSRVGLIIGWTACIALFASACIYHLKFWRVPTQLRSLQVLPQFSIGQLTWIAPLLWLVALGLCLALLIRSRTASSALLGGIWMVEAVFYGYFAFTEWLKPVFLFPTTLMPTIDFWLVNRLELLGIALLLLLLGWLLLHNTEALLQGSAGEE